MSREVHANCGFRGRTPFTLLWGEGQGTERILQLLKLLEQLLTLVWKSLDVHRCQCSLENRSYNVGLSSQVIRKIVSD